MCIHTAAQAEEALAKIEEDLKQIEAINNDTTDLVNLSKFYHCQSERFNILSEWAKEYSINGQSLDHGSFSTYSAQLSKSADIFEEYADYLDLIRIVIKNDISAQEAIVQLSGTDCAACYLEAMQNNFLINGNSGE